MICGRLNSLRLSAHDLRQSAQDAQAEEMQREAWELRVADATDRLQVAYDQLASNELAQYRAEEELSAARSILEGAIAELRLEQGVALEGERTLLEAELESVQADQAASKERHTGKPPKAERKEVSRRIRQAEQAISKNQRELQALDSWRPPAADTEEASRLVEVAKSALSKLQAEARSLNSEAKKLGHDVAEEFRFSRPSRLEPPAALEVRAAPEIPAEAPPELGDLYEHQGRRYLAIRTWEQLKRAEPVARRLQAELVVAPKKTSK